MSGHSKWSTIKHKKAASDSKRGKAFSKHAKLITLAAKAGGGDLEKNSALAMAIERAKADNTPNSNIERAIKSGTGDLKDAAQITEIMYEGYGPAGIAVLINVLTDNKNRAVANVRHALTKSGGSMGATGSVSFMFHRKGTIEIPLENKDKDELTLQLMDTGAEDIQDLGDTLLLVTEAEKLMDAKQQLEAQNITYQNPKINYLPDNTTKITDEETAKKIIKFMDALDEDEDVDEVYSNFDIDDELLQKIEV